MENKKFHLSSMILLGINGIIGSGIFLMPGDAYKLFGAQSIWIYLLDTLLVLSLALCMAEVSGMFDKSGGDYIYAREAYGEFIGFEVGVMKWAISIIGWAVMAVGFATALGRFIPGAAEGTLKNVIAVSILVGLGIMNLFGIEVAKVFNNIITVGKLVPMVLFIVIGILFMKGGNFVQVQPVEMKNLGEIVVLVFYAFTGFESVAVAAADMHNPKKNMPITIICSILISSVIYVLVQTVAVGNLGPGLSGSATPVADAAGQFLGNFGVMAISIGTLVSIGGINVATAFSAPRSGMALAEGGILPLVVAKKNRFNQPYVAIILTVLIAIPLVVSGSFVQLAVMSVISKFGQYIPTSLSMIVFRLRKKESTFRAPFGFFLPVVAVSFSLWMIGNAWVNDIGKPIAQNRVIVGLGGFAVGVPLYFFSKYMAKRRNEALADEIEKNI